MSDASEDSELAAILDEGLFPDTELDGQEGGEAVPDNPVECSSDAVAAAAADEQPEEQTAKRARTHVAASNSNSTRGVAMRSKCPPHPGWYAGMCIACGAQRTAQDLDPATIAGDAKDDSASGATTRIRHLHHRPGQALELSAHEAARVATHGVSRLLASRRLVLVLDLDHTLLNTVRDIDLVGQERVLAVQQLEKQAQQLAQQQQQRPASSVTPAAADEPAADGEQQEAKLGDAAAASAVEAEAAAADGQAAAMAGPSSSNGPVPQQPQPQQQGEQQLARPRLYHLADKGLWTKLRPGVESFLAKVSQLYELHIYTMGDKGYAGLMAHLLDPEHKLFVGRVVSAADSTRAGVKDLDVLLADESLVLILDDTEHVWEKHRANLIHVERYHYFGASARLFHPGAQSPLEQGVDEPEAGGVLHQAAQLLTRIHERVFGPAEQQQQHLQDRDDTQQDKQEQQQKQQQVRQQQQQQQQPGRKVVRRPRTAATLQSGANGSSSSVNGSASLQQQGGGSQPGAPAVLVQDVRECLAAERQNVLAGCCIVFSRCWPQHQSPSEHPLWQLALKLGAQCAMSLTPGGTTHLIVAPDKADISGLPLTDKVQAAQRAGVPVVHPDWLVACKFSWARQPEAKFTLPGYAGAGPGGFSGGGSKMLALGKAAGLAAEHERQAVMQAAGRAGNS